MNSRLISSGCAPGARKTARWLAPLLLLPAAGCLLFSDGGPTVCIDNLDCQLGMVCDTEAGICRKTDSLKPLAVVDVEVLPKDDSAAAVTHVAGLDLRTADPDNLEFVMQKPVKIWGRMDSPDAMCGVPGLLVATREPSFNDHSVTYNLSVGEAGEFEAEIAPGMYRMLFKPSDRQYFPQVALSGFDVDADVQPPLAYVAFADPSKEDQFNSQDPLLVVCGSLLQSEASRHPAQGYMVEAVGDNGLRSSLVAPDSEGNFCLRLGLEWAVMPDGDIEKLAPSSIAVSAGPASGEARLPAVSWPAVELVGPQLGTFFVGDVPPVAALSGTVVDSAGTQVSDCQIWLQVEQVGFGSFSTQLQSDSTGQFFTTLPRGQLKVKAVPPLGIEAALTDFYFDLEGDRQIQLVLDDRAHLQGVVTDESGQATEGVIVRAKRLSTVSGVEDSVVRTFETISNADGAFDLAVDTGRYMFSLRPPVSSGLPWSFPRVVYVVGDAFLESFATRLPAPTVVKGLVLDPEQAVCCDATVRFFYSPEIGPAVTLGETVLDSITAGCTGQFSLMLPADVPLSSE